MVSQADVDQTPSAVDDAFQTDVDVPLTSNVMDNDDPGDGPATIDSHSLPAHGGLTLGADGSFTYTPDGGYEGSDGFNYSIADQDGDISNTATVTITVSAGGPPPAEPSVTATPYKVKGVQHVELNWENFAGPTVTITRNTTLLTEPSTANDGLYVDTTRSAKPAPATAPALRPLSSRRGTVQGAAGPGPRNPGCQSVFIR